jgi:CTP synthase
MQLAVVAFARDVLGWKDADTTENNPRTLHPVIHLIPKQEEFMKRRAYGGTMRLGAWLAKVQGGTLADKIYSKYSGYYDPKNKIVSERHRHRYEFNQEYEQDFIRAGLRISAKSTVENLVEIVELSQDIHPFYFGIQGHPEYKSKPLSPHPVFLAFLDACASHNIHV